jgi:hypothetical protein
LREKIRKVYNEKERLRERKKVRVMEEETERDSEREE